VSLRQAAQLLQLDDDEEHANALGELVALGILGPSDLNDLGTLERRTVVAEVHKFYIAFCDEVEDSVEAMRVARAWKPLDATCDRMWIRSRLHEEVLPELKSGKISPRQIERRLNPLKWRVTWEDEPRKKKDSKGTSGSSQSSGPIGRHYTASLSEQVASIKRYVAHAREMTRADRGTLVLLPIELRRAADEIEKRTATRVDCYLEVMSTFHAVTCELSNGLCANADERLLLSSQELGRLRYECSLVESAFNSLMTQLRATEEKMSDTLLPASYDSELPEFPEDDKEPVGVESPQMAMVS
jgi:hypothetical protein